MTIRKKPDLDRLEARLGYVFTDRAPLMQALTHVSAAPMVDGTAQTYQRLEFLGDRVLGLCICDLLYRAFPRAEEGELSHRLADLVRKDTCADVAIGWDVGPHIRLGGGEMQTGARKNRAILADICEGIIGAVYLDGGLDAARALVERSFGTRMLAPPRPLRDAKTVLQEWAQGSHGVPPPVYEERGRSGPDPAPRFVIAAIVAGHEPVKAEGRSKRLAEQAAAEAFLRAHGLWRELMEPGQAAEQETGS